MREGEGKERGGWGTPAKREKRKRAGGGELSHAETLDLIRKVTALPLTVRSGFLYLSPVYIYIYILEQRLSFSIRPLLSSFLPFSPFSVSPTAYRYGRWIAPSSSLPRRGTKLASAVHVSLGLSLSSPFPPPVTPSLYPFSGYNTPLISGL